MQNPCILVILLWVKRMSSVHQYKNICNMNPAQKNKGPAIWWLDNTIPILPIYANITTIIVPITSVCLK